MAITDANGNITDTFAYDTYGKQTARTGTSDVIFAYNGRDGVVTDASGLIYMRARYYSPELRRFVNADIVAGSLNNAITLNRFAYANGNPVSFVDPFGLSAERGYGPTILEAAYMAQHIYNGQPEVVFLSNTDTESYGGWELIDERQNEEGLKMGLYRKEINGKFCYTVANAGSADLVDWINNLQQPFGNSKDMKDSIRHAISWTNKYKGAHFTFVGHSKGGGEAIANAVATGYNAITFNPATPRLCEYGLSTSEYHGSIDNYIVEDEILHKVMNFAADVASPKLKEKATSHIVAPTSIFGVLALEEALFYYRLGHALQLTPVGNVHYLPEGCSETIKSANIIERHDIKIVINALEEIINKSTSL